MMNEGDAESGTRRRYQDLSLDLNLDKATADEAWANYENIKASYTLEGDQLPWLACALYTACRKRTVPTVGGRPENASQGNYVSLTGMLQYCNLSLTEFILKMKHWLAMSHCPEDFCRKVDLLERNFAVSNNIYKKYKPIFLDVFQDPVNDAPRPPRSRKQRRPLCNATELYQFCWTLYTYNKGKYQGIPQDLVSCYSLLLAAIDLMYTNIVLSNRLDLLNKDCKGLPEGLFSDSPTPDLSSWSESIVDYLCTKFDGVIVETKVVSEYYWKKNIKDLVEKGILKGSPEGTGLLNQLNFDHNVKEIKNAYEEHLLSCGEFDERMFLDEESQMLKVPSKPNSPVAPPPSNRGPIGVGSSPVAGPPLSPKVSPVLIQRSLARYNLTNTFDGDHHLVPYTPITGRKYTINRPIIGSTPIAVSTSGLQKLYSLISGRKGEPSDHLREILSSIPGEFEDRIAKLVKEMSQNFTRLYSEQTEDYSTPSPEFTKMRLQMGQILYYTFLEHILTDEKRRDVDLKSILNEDLFHKTLFTASLEIVLKSYNDARRFPWSLSVGNVDPYYFIRIIEPVIRSEKQSDNQLSRESVKHLKCVEEQILDSLAWRSESPMWRALEIDGEGVPSCEDVNFSHQLETKENLALASSSLMSPAIGSNRSPISSLVGSPAAGATARRMLFVNSAVSSPVKPATSPVDTSKTGQDVLVESTANLLGFSESAAQKSTTTDAVNPSISPADAVQSGDTTTKEPEATVILSASESPGAQPPEKSEKPKRHGSLALFFRKFYTMANMRLRDLCDRLEISSPDLRQKIWTCFEYSIIHHTDLMRDRHLDQIIMCSIYIICKVTANERIFQEIMKHYRNQPQAASHVYRNVLINRDRPTGAGTPIVKMESDTLGQPTTNTTASTPLGERGDLIKFYNQVYVISMKIFAQKFRPASKVDVPRLSPLPVARLTPVSPRRRISMNHPVYINSLSPLKPSVTIPRKPLPYFFNRSPAKDLHVINSMIKSQNVAAPKRIFDDAEKQDGDDKIPRMGMERMVSRGRVNMKRVIGERQQTLSGSQGNLNELADVTNSSEETVNKNSNHCKGTDSDPTEDVAELAEAAGIAVETSQNGEQPTMSSINVGNNALPLSDKTSSSWFEQDLL